MQKTRQLRITIQKYVSVNPNNNTNVNLYIISTKDTPSEIGNKYHPMCETIVNKNNNVGTGYKQLYKLTKKQ